MGVFSKKDTRDFYVLPALGKGVQWGLDNYTTFGQDSGWQHYAALAVTLPIAVTLLYQAEHYIKLY